MIMLIDDNLRVKLNDSIKETTVLLRKEIAYSPDLRNKENVDFYNKHIAFLENALVIGQFDTDGFKKNDKYIEVK